MYNNVLDPIFQYEDAITAYTDGNVKYILQTIHGINMDRKCYGNISHQGFKSIVNVI